MTQIYKSKVLGFFLGPFPTIAVSDEKSIKELLLKPEFQGRIDQVLSLIRVNFGEERGMIFTEGERWQQQKRFFLQNLRNHGYGKRSERLEAELVDEVQDLVKFLQEEKDHHLYRDGNLLVPSIFAWGNLNLLLKALTNERFVGPKGKEFLENLHSTTLRFQLHSEACANTLTFVPFSKYFPPFSNDLKDILQLNDTLANAAKDSIRKRLEAFQEDKIECAVDAFIKEMKQAQSQNNTSTYFTEDQLQLIIQDLTFTSSNTISGQLGFLWEQFLIHPEVQTKIQEEIDQVVGKNQLPTLDHRKEMHYTEATLREIMRYRTLVALAVPHRSTADAEFMGYFVKKGTILLPNLHSFHHDKDIWGDPENFRPERFINDDGTLMKKDRTLSFGLGKRICPGETFARQNMFMFVTHLLQKFTFTLPPNTKPPDDSDYYPGLNIHPKHMWTRVVPRQ